MSDIPALGELVDFEPTEEDERHWLLLFDEDYDDVVHDLEDNLGILVDQEQAGEVLRLSAQILADLSHKDADGDDVIGDMIEALEEVRDDD